MSPTTRALLACLAGLAGCRRGLAEPQPQGPPSCDVQQPDGQCRRPPVASEAPAADHLMIQLRQQGSLSAPGQFGCSGMPDVKRSCSANGCKVLAKTQGRSCSEYCGLSGRTCMGAWEETWDNCEVKFGWNCDQPLGGTSDLLCECSPDPPEPVDPAQVCTAMPDVKRTCSATGCKVLAKTDGKSCSQYCGLSGRTCLGAWEETWDNCEVKFDWNCDQPLGGTSDLLCECSPDNSGPGDVISDQPEQTKMCGAMPDVKQSCSANGCKVLANTAGRSCSEYCRASGRRCAAAWEEVSDNCEVKYDWNCDQPLEGTSDLLCQCDPEVSEEPLPAPSPTQPPVPAPTSPPLPTKGGRLVWSDDFDGWQVDGSKWKFVHGGGGYGNQERQYYSQRNAVVRDGALRITAKCEDYKGERFTSAKITTEGIATWGPGHRVEVRARLPQGKGTWPAIWMLPADKVYGNWPHSGEIDIMEAVGCTRDKIYGTVHTGRYNHMKNTEKYNSLSTGVSDWHTYSIEWEDREIRWFVDGQQYHSFAPSAYDSERWPFNQRFYLILNLAVGGSWGGYCVGGTPSCSTSDQFAQEQVMEVDFARVYSMK